MVLAGTPVGNPADASPRLRDLIEQADIIAAEDTRRFRRLAADLGVAYSANVVSFYEAVEREKAAELADAGQDGLGHQRQRQTEHVADAAVDPLDQGGADPLDRKSVV